MLPCGCIILWHCKCFVNCLQIENEAQLANELADVSQDTNSFRKEDVSLAVTLLGNVAESTETVREEVVSVEFIKMFYRPYYAYIWTCAYIIHTCLHNFSGYNLCTILVVNTTYNQTPAVCIHSVLFHIHWKTLHNTYQHSNSLLSYNLCTIHTIWHHIDVTYSVKYFVDRPLQHVSYSSSLTCSTQTLPRVILFCYLHSLGPTRCIVHCRQYEQCFTRRGEGESICDQIL